jgi:hypothetical protein
MRFNAAISSILRIESKDYYSQLTLSDFMTFKAALARVHDIVTLKLSAAMGVWICDHFSLTASEKTGILDRIDSAHPNASGFDIDCVEPNVIAEVKGNFPMNAGNRFGAAQLRGLTNDVFGMLGLASLGKDEDELKRKLSRPARAQAHKFLGLIDSREVRDAASSWMGSLNRSYKMTAHGYLVVDEPQSGPAPRRTDAVYVVYLPVVLSLGPQPQVVP